MINKTVKLDISKDEILVCLKKALNQNFIDNLRNRTEIVKFDSKIRGYIGELGLTKWFNQNKIYFSKVNFIEENESMDMDFVFETKKKSYILEVKTSLIPDIWEDIDNCLQKADIKLIKRTKKIDNLHGDFHLQIYFNKLRKERDLFLNKLILDLKSDPEEIYSKMELGSYESFFVAWIDKKTLIEYINDLEKKGKVSTWRFSFRSFWKCPIKDIGKDPFLLISTLKELMDER